MSTATSRLLLSAVVVCLALSPAGAARARSFDGPGVRPDGSGVIVPPSDIRDEISPAQHERIHLQNERNAVRLRARGRLGVIAPPEPGGQPPTVLLDWPLQAVPAYTDPGFYGISTYIDHDLTFDANPDVRDPATIEDYECGKRTYDTTNGYNHQGTDIYLTPYGWNMMDAGTVEVIAAAAGTIINKADGNYDRNCGFNNTPANFVIVEHSDGSRAWYFHLKNGSVTAKNIGESVARGEYLGTVGSSGSSTGPHLHFEVYNSTSTLNDPWDGACNDFNATSWWNVQPSYREKHLIRLATGNAAPNYGTCPNPETPNEQFTFNPGNTIYFDVHLRDFVLNDSFNITIYRPNNTVFYTSTFTDIHGDYSTALSYYFFTTFSAGGPTGTWHWDVTYNAVTTTASFTLTSGTLPTPTPTAGGTATLTPTSTAPTPTPTATPVLDHFTCYKSATTKGAAKFVVRTGVSLVDFYGPSTVSVTKRRVLCPPTNKNGEDPTAPLHAEHLEGYAIKPVVKQTYPTGRQVIDQFNPTGLLVDVKKPSHLLVPSVKDPSVTPPTPAAFVVDHFECYQIKGTTGAPKFVVQTATIVDQLAQPLTVQVKKPRFLCNPVDKNGEDPTAPTDSGHLLCYQIKATSLPKYVKVTGLHINNQFGPETLDAAKPMELCVPATTNP